MLKLQVQVENRTVKNKVVIVWQTSIGKVTDLCRLVWAQRLRECSHWKYV